MQTRAVGASWISTAAGLAGPGYRGPGIRHGPLRRVDPAVQGAHPGGGVAKAGRRFEGGGFEATGI
ncbi:hypothetical protein NHG85_15140, partial [Limimaricola sp. ASW11-118]